MHFELPSYDQLPADPEAPPGSAWGLWGADDEVGTLNILTPDHARGAAQLVRTGRVFSLNWNLELPDPPLFGRQPLEHRRVKPHGSINDDVMDAFYPQASSQWDALSHVEHPEHGFYNGRTQDQVVDPARPHNGIEHWARRGIAARGVLLDVARVFAAQGRPIDPAAKVEIGVDDLRVVARAQGVEICPGDILLVRTGWIEWYDGLDTTARTELARSTQDLMMASPGLVSHKSMVRFLWNSHVAACATDTPTFEAWPNELRAGDGGYMHYDLIALLGMPLGELWALDALAEDCAVDGRYEFLLTSAPLNKEGGVGSPPNALAIK